MSYAQDRTCVASPLVVGPLLYLRGKHTAKKMARSGGLHVDTSDMKILHLAERARFIGMVGKNSRSHPPNKVGIISHVRRIHYTVCTAPQLAKQMRDVIL